MIKKPLKPGAFDEIASVLGASSDEELAAHIGLTVEELRTARYEGLGIVDADRIVRLYEAHRKTADMLRAATA